MLFFVFFFCAAVQQLCPRLAAHTFLAAVIFIVENYDFDVPRNHENIYDSQWADQDRRLWNKQT